MEEKVYLNGWVGTFEEACVPVNDRGYIFGDGVYEVIRAYNGSMFALDEHLNRLENSAEAIDMKLPHDREGLKTICRDVLETSDIKEAIVYIQVTRGTEHRNHIYSPDIEPNLLVTVRHIPDIPAYIYNKGIKVVTTNDLRWGMCNVKSISLQANVLAKNRARNCGAEEVVFVSKDSTVTECGSSNIFIYKDGCLYTHPEDNKILPGITRRFIVDIAGYINLNLEITPFTVEDMLLADEVFCTNTVEEIMPVIDVDGNTIGKGRPGPVADRLHKEFIYLREQNK